MDDTLSSSALPDTQAALDFLQRWRPGGPWVLTAISVDRKKIETATLADLEQARVWIDRYNGDRNLYFMVNPAVRPLTSKAAREDVAALAWLHVDIDPRAGEDLAQERTRALGLLLAPPGDVPPPTCIVFSGGGYQGFWKLAEPFQIGGDLELAERAKLWNLQLETVFGADKCHDVCRIMRLPGTINIPDRKKREKGRTAVLAKVEEWDDGRVYELARFTAAAAREPAAASQPAKLGEVAPLTSIDQLDQWGVPDRVKVIVQHGHNRDVEGPKQPDDSRSEWLFDAVCHLLRCQVPDETIYALITDPSFGVSASVLDKGSRVESYALRQIARAKDFVADPRLAELNERFAVIENIGGKCRVVEEQEDPALGRSRLTHQSFADFRNRFMHNRIQIGVRNGEPQFMSLGEWWLRHPRRRQFERIVFSPEGDPPGAYNLWRGFGCEARPGDCSLFLAHVRENICAGSDERHRYLLGWMARAVQRPAERGHVAVVLRGKRGTGKGFFAQELGALFGRHFLQVADPKHLVGSFNAHLRDVLVLFADEAFYAGDKKHESILKALITENSLTIEAKGIDVEPSPNYVHLILASNDQWVVPAGEDERRFFVLDVTDDRKQDLAYFAAIAAQMKSGGRQALLHFLQSYDLAGYEVRAVPRTAALYSQMEHGLPPVQKFWLECLQTGIAPYINGVIPTEMFREETQRFTNARPTISYRAVADFLGKPPRHQQAGARFMDFERSRDSSERGYALPPLVEARARWCEVMFPVEWGEVADWKESHEAVRRWWERHL